MSLPDDHFWVLAETDTDVMVDTAVRRPMHDVVAKVGPGLRGRWWLLFGPPRTPTPPHDHEIRGLWSNPDADVRCRDPRCWGRTVLSAGQNPRPMHLDKRLRDAVEGDQT